MAQARHCSERGNRKDFASKPSPEPFPPQGSQSLSGRWTMRVHRQAWQVSGTHSQTRISALRKRQNGQDNHPQRNLGSFTSTGTQVLRHVSPLAPPLPPLGCPASPARGSRPSVGLEPTTLWLRSEPQWQLPSSVARISNRSKTQEKQPLLQTGGGGTTGQGPGTELEHKIISALH